MTTKRRRPNTATHVAIIAGIALMAFATSAAALRAVYSDENGCADIACGRDYQCENAGCDICMIQLDYQCALIP